MAERMVYRDWLALAYLEKVSDPDSAKHPKGRSGYRGQTPFPQTRTCHGISSQRSSERLTVKLDSCVQHHGAQHMEKKQPAISVILCTYNQPAWLEKVLWGYSVQQFKDFEIVVADDGSRAETSQCIEQMRSKTQLVIQHVWHPDDGFRKCEILNHAIRCAEAPYLVFSDGDCIPRKDFLLAHFSNRRQGQYLSGGAVRLPRSISCQITRDDIVSGSAFSVSWLLKHSQWNSLPRWYRLIRVSSTGTLATVLNSLTPTRPTWNGGNASAWKSDVVAVNGMDERMTYGGEDCELGDRLANAGLKPKQLRYSAALLHLDHDRGYVREEAIERNMQIRKQSNSNRSTWTHYGIRQVVTPVRESVRLNGQPAAILNTHGNDLAPRFFICDSEILRSGGHNVELASVIADAAKRKGFEPVVVTSRGFQNNADFDPSYTVRPTFRFTFMRKWSLGVDGKSRAARDFHGRLEAPNPVRSALLRAAEQINGDSPTTAIRTWAEDFAHWCQEFQPNRKDRIMLSTACDFTLLGLVAALQKFPTQEMLHIDLLFHLSLLEGREGEVQERQNTVLRAFKRQVESSLAALSHHKVTLYATTEELARQLNQAVGADLWTAIDYPIRTREDLDNSDDPTRGSRATVESGNKIGPGRSRLMLAGNIRREKGRYELAGLINQIWHSHLAMGRWQLAFQLPQKRWNRLLPRFLWSQVEVFRNSQDSELVLGDATLDMEKYQAWIRSATVGLFIYDGRRYYARCSGILLEMLAAGIPVFVPAGSWLSRQLRPAIDRHIDAVWDVAEVECKGHDMSLVDLGDQTVELNLHGMPPATAIILSFPESPDFGDSIILSAAFLNSTAGASGADSEYSLEHRADDEPRVIVAIPADTKKVYLRYRYMTKTTKAVGIPRVRAINTSHAPPESAVGLIATSHDQIPRLMDEFHQHAKHYQATAREFAREISARHSPDRFVETVQNCLRHEQHGDLRD